MAAAVLLAAAAAAGQPRPIDAGHSVMTVHVYKAGMLSALGHDHEISAPVSGGTVDTAAKSVELRIVAAELKVQDAKANDKDRAEIQATMTGAEVLDAQNYKEIRFHSTAVAGAGTGAWKLAGELTLHGQSRPVSVQVRELDGHYTGTCRLNLSDFGIKPVKAAGGTVRVKDEIQIDFDIRLAH